MVLPVDAGRGLRAGGGGPGGEVEGARGGGRWGWACWVRASFSSTSGPSYVAGGLGPAPPSRRHTRGQCSGGSGGGSRSSATGRAGQFVLRSSTEWRMPAERGRS
ncbi:hypothetical protein KCH_52870 [Kitasatospora cheerisanensis KCTC 2395]|uniref:Uncharacterized protein n=1 Tax=Kitasatospora cheerisanensis KCTC 2395 TaxID=1348663 RepID=A0A066YNV2_9ACTN|nr:hypothetical protein KCH_52870 [Kitasatospora cheerisanensis KCTC 2395]